MGVLGDLGKKVGTAAETTAAKAKEQMEVTKLNNAISGDEKKIEKLYTEIGRLAFEAEKGKDGPYRELTGEVLALQSAIEEYRRKIAQVKEAGKQEGGGSGRAGPGK